MKQRLTFALAAALALGLGGVAHAQSAERGDIGVYFDPAGTTTAGVVVPFVPFQFYVISTNVRGGQEGYEFWVEVDDRLSVIAEGLQPAGNTLDFGQDPAFPFNDKNYLVGTGGVCLEGHTTVLVVISALLLNSVTTDDITFCLKPANPSSFSPAAPGYLACDSPGELRTYSPAYDGCAVANSDNVVPPVTVEHSTWGSVKARF